ncbi:MAG: hypothetical protein P9M03_04465 [Candidatus Theseobacter exili]|nr:hypothetical protein [Candidatus Theseobacter exili]
MQKTITRQLLGLFCFFVLFIMFGCGGKNVAVEKSMAIPQLGISVIIPDGWLLDSSTMCHKDDYTGIIVVIPLNGKSFDAIVNNMYKESDSVIISKKPCRIDGVEAVKAVLEFPSASTKMIRVYIHKGQYAVLLSFAVLKNDFQKYEPVLKKSVQSIKVKL